MTDTKTTRWERRTHFQFLAYKKLRWAFYMGGDGEWLVLWKCHPTRWCYKLFPLRLDADIFKTEMDLHGHGNRYECHGPASHSMFRLLEDIPAPAPVIPASPRGLFD